MASEYDMEAIASMQAGWAADQAERDRLRAINADLLAALNKINNCSHHKRAWEIATAAIAAAEAASKEPLDFSSYKDKAKPAKAPPPPPDPNTVTEGLEQRSEAETDD